MRKVPRQAVRYVNSKISNESDAQLFAETCLVVAEELQCDGLRSLTGKDVFSRIEADPKHPARRLYNAPGTNRWDDARDARRQRVADTSKWIVGIRRVTIASPEKLDEVFVTARVSVPDGSRFRKVLRKTLKEDLLRNDPAFLSAINVQVHQIRMALRQLEHLTNSKEPSLRVAQLRDALVEAFEQYNAAG